MTLEFNPEMARAFMKFITDPWGTECDDAGIFEIRCINSLGGPVRSQLFSRSRIEEALRWGQGHNENAYNIYMTINPLRSDLQSLGASAKDEDVISAHYIFADADDEEGMVGLENLSKELPPSLVVTTGTIPFERRHAYWRLNEPTKDLKRWQKIQKALAQKYNTDCVIINPSRIMRVPGFISHPSHKKLQKGYESELVTLKEQW